MQRSTKNVYNTPKSCLVISLLTNWSSIELNIIYMGNVCEPREDCDDRNIQL